LRLYAKYTKSIEKNAEEKIGFIARCNSCGDQFVSSLKNLKRWEYCICNRKSKALSINGPLWIGELQSSTYIKSLINISDEELLFLSRTSKNTLKKLGSDPGDSPCRWSTAGLASRLTLKAQPRIKTLIRALKEEGYSASASAIMSGQIRTNALYKELLRVSQFTTQNHF
tara:strand:- start:177 stop:686 length:510 start_codon:yes stop_codon:yes gene_type:complete